MFLKFGHIPLSSGRGIEIRPGPKGSVVAFYVLEVLFMMTCMYESGTKNVKETF